MQRPGRGADPVDGALPLFGSDPQLGVDSEPAAARLRLVAAAAQLDAQRLGEQFVAASAASAASGGAAGCGAGDAPV